MSPGLALIACGDKKPDGDKRDRDDDSECFRSSMAPMIELGDRFEVDLQARKPERGLAFAHRRVRTVIMPSSCRSSIE